MKIETMSTRDLLDRMGSDTTDAQAKAMWEFINAGGWSDTDEISDTKWVALIAEAVEKAQ